jgi:ATP-binding cassette, subfamily B, bacterial MsbA
VHSLLQLWPYVCRQQRRLVAAFAAALVASLLWGLAMLLAFPVTKVLLEQQSLAEYVDAEIQTARREIAKQSSRIAVRDQELAQWPRLTLEPDGEYVAALRDRARGQATLSAATRREWWFVQLQHWLMPYVPADRFDTLALLFGLLLAVTALHGGAVYLQEVWIGQVVQLSMRSLRARLFRRTLRLDAQTLATEGTPALMSRFTNDLTGIAQGITLLGGKIVLEPLKAGICIASAFAINWRLTLLSLVCAPLAALLFQHFGSRLKRASRRQMETVARLYQVLQEALASFRVVTAFGNARHHRLRLYRENRAYYHKAMQINRIDAAVNPTVELLGVTAACLAILPGAYLVLRQQTGIWGFRLTDLQMDLASLALLYSLLGGVLDPARKLSSAFSKLKKASAATGRVFDWMHRSTLVPEAEANDRSVRHGESLEFDRITFRYHAAGSPSRQSVLQDVSLTIPFGEVVAIVGGNGSGKSTLAGLLPRFYDPQEGSVRIDGVDTRALTLRELRSQIGWVPQESMLFEGTVADNIAIGCPTAIREQVEAAARRAHVWDFASTWPQGLDTPIGDGGNRLSGGQRQRIAVARAMLRDPAILILDEATSAIDAHSEFLIQSALREFCRGRTTLVITHLLTDALLEFVTKVVVLDQGRVLAVGTHAQLQATCPPYAALYQAQQNRRAG